MLFLPLGWLRQRHPGLGVSPGSRPIPYSLFPIPYSQRLTPKPQIIDLQSQDLEDAALILWTLDPKLETLHHKPLP